MTADQAGLTDQQLETLKKEGILVVKNFLTQEEIVSLRNGCNELVEAMNPQEHRAIFSTTSQKHGSSQYFLDSGDKIRFFFEEEVFQEDGQMKPGKNKFNSLNKMGHALHTLQDDFRKVTFSDKVKAAATSLGFRDPAVVQGMYIFKQPGVGGEVTPHQDGTFLNNDPLSLYGFWFPVDNATLENGCLWYVPGSHERPVDARYVRTGNAEKFLDFRGKNHTYSDEDWIAAPVQAGDLVLIHGKVYHKSEKNTSTKPRHAYTFHIIEMDGSKYSEENWLQPPPGKKFPMLFEE